MKSNLP